MFSPTDTRQPTDSPTFTPPYVDEMLQDAELAQAERRRVNRTPYFVPVFVSTEDGAKYTCFTRDISRTGIGLLHCEPIEPQHITVLLTRNRGHIVELEVKITWCNSCGDGWYVSGGGVENARVRGKQ